MAHPLIVDELHEHKSRGILERLNVLEAVAVCISLEQRAERFHRTFPKFPRMIADRGWLLGVWTLGNNYRGSGYYGAYPPAYLKRLAAVLPELERLAERRILHLFSGSLPASTRGIRFDLRAEGCVRPDVQGDARRLPFADETFGLIVADPPYGARHAKAYGTPMINRRLILAEAARVTKPGGILVWLDTRTPMYRKADWRRWGAIAVDRSTNHAIRMVHLFRREPRA